MQTRRITLKNHSTAVDSDFTWRIGWKPHMVMVLTDKVDLAIAMEGNQTVSTTAGTLSSMLSLGEASAPAEVTDAITFLDDGIHIGENTTFFRKTML